MNPYPSISVEKLIIFRGTHRSARAANSILSPNYSDEEVALIPPHPEWGILTLGNLKNIGGPAAAKLARDQGLTPSDGSPDSDQARIRNLNMILRHLGVSCAHLCLFLNLSRLMANIPDSGRVSGCSLVERHPPHVGHEKDEQLITPVEVPLYFYLAYLTLFVYSSIVL